MCFCGRSNDAAASITMVDASLESKNSFDLSQRSLYEAHGEASANCWPLNKFLE